jgi:hypothetical protein
MHHRMWRLVECDVEVFALLVCARHSAAFESFGECGSGGADFAVYNFIVEGLTRFDCAVEEVFADVVDDAADFSNLFES